MSNKKAFVRYADNKAVAGSLVVRTEAPSVGVWKEVPFDLCCQTTSASCVILQGVPNGSGEYGFSLQPKNSGPNLKGIVRWAVGQEESFNLVSNGTTYDFFYNYGDQLPHTVQLCVENPSQMQDFELGFGPGDTVSLDNAQSLKGVDEWDSDSMNIYSLDLSGMIGLTQLYHCCSVLTHINITGSVNLEDVDLRDNQLTQASVDHVLIALDNHGVGPGYLDLSGGTNAIPSAAGLAAKTNLEAFGWTVFVNS